MHVGDSHGTRVYHGYPLLHETSQVTCSVFVVHARLQASYVFISRIACVVCGAISGGVQGRCTRCTVPL